MALTLLTEPPAQAFAGNLLVYRANTTNLGELVNLELTVAGQVYNFPSFPDALGNVEFRVQSTVASAIATENLPNLAQLTNTFAIQSYSVVISQTGETDLNPSSRQALIGAFEDQQYPSRSPTFFAATITLLTDQGQPNKRVGPNQRERLYFVTSLNFVEVRVDGNLVESIPTNANTIYGIDVSPSRFGINDGNYTVDLGNGVVSQTYRVDIKPRAYIREYIYRNNFGMWEVLRTTGERDKTDKGQAQSAVLELPYNYTQATGREVQFNIDNERMYLQRSGWFNKKEMGYLTYQLANTERIYEVLQDGSLLPFIITKRTFKFEENAIGLQDLPIELMLAY